MDRMQYEAPTIFSQTKPQVSVDDGAAQYLTTKANIFLNNANDAHKRQLAIDLDRAKVEGENIGYNAAEKFKPLKTGSLFARQFNESGVQRAVQKISINTQSKVSQLAANFKANPEGLEQSLAAFKQGYVDELPEEMTAPFEAQFDVVAKTALAQATADLQDVTQKQSEADFYEYERAVINSMENIAPATFKNGPEADAAREAIALLRKQYVESLIGNGPNTEFSVGGYNVSGANGRSGAFDPLEIQKKITAFDKAVISAGVIGNFEEEAKNGNAVDAYMSFVKGDMEISTLSKDASVQEESPQDILDAIVPLTQEQLNGGLKPPSGASGKEGIQTPNQSLVADNVPLDEVVDSAIDSPAAPAKAEKSYKINGMTSIKIKDFLTNDEMEDVASKMRSYIGGINSIEEGQYKKLERQRDLYNEGVLSEAYKSSLEVVEDDQGNQRVIGGDPVSLQNVISQAISNPLVKPDTIDKLQRLAADLGTGQIDDPRTVGTIYQGIAEGEVTSYQAIPRSGVSDATRLKLYEALDKRTSGNHWSNSKRYQIAQDYADAILAPEKSIGFMSSLGPDNTSAADRSEWSRRMIEETLAAEVSGIIPMNPNALPSKTKDGRDEFDFVSRGKAIADEIAAKRKKPESPAIVQIDTEIKAVEDAMNNPKGDEDPEILSNRLRELTDRKAKLQTDQMMGVQ